METPVYSEQKSCLVLVDFAGVQAANLAPSTCRVVAILEVLGCENESGQEHAAAAHKSAGAVAVIRLLHSKIVLWHVCLDKNKIVQSYLKS